MMAELKHLHSPDVEDLVSWTPENADFAILVQIIVGPAGTPGEESFDATVCSSAWVKRKAAKEKIIEGRHLLIVSEYNYTLISEYISNYVSTCQGETWKEITDKLSRLGRWEFEDYQE
jgi:immunity protein 8 of polymorphic toxin system